MRNSTFSALLVSFLALMVSGLAQSGDDKKDDDSELRPSGKGWGEKDNNAAGGKSRGTSGISYHGGPVMLGQTNVYYIWYGNWSGNTAAQSILNYFAYNIGGSPYFNINTTYFDGSGKHVSNLVTLGGATSDNYSEGASLSDAAILSVVSKAIAKSGVADPNGVYFVLTSADVTATSGFCTQYCGWHDHATIGGKDVKYSFVGNPDRCPSSCAAQTIGPNGNAGADAMASIIAHELEESVTDPDLNAWYDSRGQENGDKCAWTFGTVSTARNGSKYNMTLGTANYLIQQNWLNVGAGSCALKY